MIIINNTIIIFFQKFLFTKLADVIDVSTLKQFHNFDGSTCR